MKKGKASEENGGRSEEATPQGHGPGRGRGRGGAGRGGAPSRGRGQSRGRGRGGAGGNNNHFAQRGNTARKPTSRRGGSHAHTADASATALPGLNKLKAAVRQTKRLLARDDLNPETRQEAERKLIALDEDIAAKEDENVRREVAVKNKRLIFFDSVKASRKIKPLLKAHQQAQSRAEADKTDSEARAQLQKIEKQLRHFRVILHYTQHWPALERYSRFHKTEPDYDPAAPSSRRDDDEDSDAGSSSSASSDDDEEAAAGPSRNKNNAADEKKKTRASKKELRRIEFAREHRAWVERAMKAGELSAEPEKEHEGEGERKSRAGARSGDGAGSGLAPGTRKGDEKGKRRRDESGEESEDEEETGSSDEDEEDGAPVTARASAKKPPRKDAHLPPKAAHSSTRPRADVQQRKKSKTAPATADNNTLADDDFFDL
ncbi:hypothetical protein V8E36_003179 [Tilletia maclaganii]